jgi:hypothetical protein
MWCDAHGGAGRRRHCYVLPPPPCWCDAMWWYVWSLARHATHHMAITDAMWCDVIPLIFFMTEVVTSTSVIIIQDHWVP